MKRKSKKHAKNITRYSPFDLFGEIPVTHDEVILWCLHVPKLPADSPRLAWYIKNWSVVDKIRNAKRLKPLDEYLGIA